MIKKYFVLLILFFIVPPFTTFTTDVPNSALIVEQVKTKYHACNPHPTLEKQAQQIITDCGITRPVIILQRNNHDNSYTYAEPTKHPHIFMIIANHTYNDQTISDIYHEAGHIHNNDISIARVQADYRFAQFAKFFATGTTIAHYLHSRISSKIVRGGLSLGIGSLIFLGGAFALQYRKSIREERADEFAYSKLIEHNKMDIALSQIMEYLDEHENARQKDLPRFLTGYPTALERAKNGLRIIRKQYTDSWTELIASLPDTCNINKNSFQKMFLENIKKYCPEFLDKC